MEPFFIKEFQSFKNGYNLTEGGEGTFGKKQSEKTNHYNHKQYPKEIKKVNGIMMEKIINSVRFTQETNGH